LGSRERLSSDFFRVRNGTSSTRCSVRRSRDATHSSPPSSSLLPLCVLAPLRETPCLRPTSGKPDRYTSLPSLPLCVLAPLRKTPCLRPTSGKPDRYTSLPSLPLCVFAPLRETSPFPVPLPGLQRDLVTTGAKTGIDAIRVVHPSCLLWVILRQTESFWQPLSYFFVLTIDKAKQVSIIGV
jgi:hypothetical protein